MKNFQSLAALRDDGLGERYSSKGSAHANRAALHCTNSHQSEAAR